MWNALLPSSSSLSIHRSGEKALQSAYTSCADAVDEDQVTSRGSHPGDQMHPSHRRCTTIATEVSTDAPSWCRCTGSHGSSGEILPMRWMGDGPSAVHKREDRRSTSIQEISERATRIRSAGCNPGEERKFPGVVENARQETTQGRCANAY